MAADDRGLSESSFLAREAEIAAEAISRTLEDLKGDLMSAADLEVWTRRHPWGVVGAAAAVGFIAASAIVPRSKNDAPRQAKGAKEGEGAGHRAGWLMLLVAPVVEAVRSSAEELIKSALHRGEPPARATNGRPAASTTYV